MFYRFSLIFSNLVHISDYCVKRQEEKKKNEAYIYCIEKVKNINEVNCFSYIICIKTRNLHCNAEKIKTKFIFLFLTERCTFFCTKKPNVFK